MGIFQVSSDIRQDFDKPESQHYPFLSAHEDFLFYAQCKLMLKTLKQNAKILLLDELIIDAEAGKEEVFEMTTMGNFLETDSENGEKLSDEEPLVNNGGKKDIRDSNFIRSLFFSVWNSH